jgi:hypothetical protein
MSDDPPVTDLVTRAAAGDKQAWDGLVERYAPLMWSICRRHRLSDADVGVYPPAASLPATDRPAPAGPARTVSADQRQAGHPGQQHRAHLWPLPGQTPPRSVDRSADRRRSRITRGVPARGACTTRYCRRRAAHRRSARWHTARRGPIAPRRRLRCRRKRTSVTLASPAPGHTAPMPLSCCLSDMNAAFMPYEGMAGPGLGVTGGRERLCGTTGTVAGWARPFTIKKLSDIALQQHGSAFTS